MEAMNMKEIGLGICCEFRDSKGAEAMQIIEP
jgi:hypothetical protein